MSAETAARERANATAARLTVQQKATTFVAQIRRDVELRAAGHMGWLAGYFGVETALTAVVDDGRLTVLAAYGDSSLTTGVNISGKLSPCREILESNSSLVLADASTHACFSTGPYHLEGVRFFAGVPLLAPEGIAIGVICVLDSHVRRTQAEDLLILEQVGRQGSLLFRLLALGRPESELPGRLGAGMLLRPALEILLDAEMRLLRHAGGSIELAVIEMDEPEHLRQAVMEAHNRDRLAAGSLGSTRAAVFKRDSSCEASSEIHALVSRLSATTHLRGVGGSGIAGDHLPALGGQDLLRLAELALEHALQSGDAEERLVLHHERYRAGDVLSQESLASEH